MYAILNLRGEFLASRKGWGPTFTKEEKGARLFKSSRDAGEYISQYLGGLGCRVFSMNKYRYMAVLQIGVPSGGALAWYDEYELNMINPLWEKAIHEWEQYCKSEKYTSRVQYRTIFRRVLNNKNVSIC